MKSEKAYPNDTHLTYRHKTNHTHPQAHAQQSACPLASRCGGLYLVSRSPPSVRPSSSRHHAMVHISQHELATAALTGGYVTIPPLVGMRDRADEARVVGRGRKAGARSRRGERSAASRADRSAGGGRRTGHVAGNGSQQTPPSCFRNVALRAPGDTCSLTGCTTS